MTYTQIISMYANRAKDEIITYIAGTSTRSYTYNGKRIVVDNIDEYIEDPNAEGVKIRVETENGVADFLHYFSILDYFSMADEINSKKSVYDPARDTILHELETLLKHADEVVIREIVERGSRISLPELGGELDYDSCHNVVIGGKDGAVPIRQIMSDRDYIEKIADRVKSIGAYRIARTDLSDNARSVIEKFIYTGRTEIMSTFIRLVTNNKVDLDKVGESGRSEYIKNFIETAPASQVETIAKYCEVNLLEPVM